MKSHSFQHKQNRWIICLGLMIMAALPLQAAQSKWQRVKPLSTELLSGKPGYRLEKEAEIFEILYEQEDGYPIIYVDQNASGSSTGDSWENAFRSLQQGIDKANDLGEAWVWVAKGTYTGSYMEDGLIVGAFKLKSGAMVFGGFAGGETRLSHRNVIQNETVIHGKAGPYGPRAVDMEHLSLIDGFLIRDSGYKGYEATLARNVAGGGIRTHGWLAVIRNNRITGCYAKGGGGIAVWVDETHRGERYYAPIIDSNTIYRNVGKCGAGVQLRNDEAFFSHNVVAYNNHPDRAKGIEAIIQREFGDGSIVINNIVWRNSTAYWGSDEGYTFHDLYNHVRSEDIARCYYNCFSDIRPSEHFDGLMVENPGFVDEENDDYRLLDTSPCIDAGHPDSPLDVDGTRADMGVRKSVYQLHVNTNDVPEQLPLAGWYDRGARVAIEAVTPVVVNDNTRYLFQQWEGQGHGAYSGNAIDTTITMLGDITQTMIWDKQYKLNVETNTFADSAGHWHGADNQIILKVPALWYESDSVRYRFLSWHLDGAASTQIQDTTLTIKMTAPLSVSANWLTEYRVNAWSAHASVDGAGWYAAGSMATLKADTVVADNASHRYRFHQWTGNAGSIQAESDSVALTINNPVTLQAMYRDQYLLTIESDYGTPFGHGWHDMNADIVFGIDSLIAIGEGSRYHLQEWTCDGSGYAGSLAHTSVVITGPVTQKAHWQKEYWLSLTMEPENGGTLTPWTTPGEWLKDNQYIQLTAKGNADLGYGFKAWSGDAYSDRNMISFRMNAPKNMIAEFALGEYTVTTIPPGLTIVADDIEFTTPQIFYWKPGQTHQISTTGLQEQDSGIRHQFTRWQHNPAQANTIVLSEKNKIFTAEFDTSYQVSIESEFGETTGSGWHRAGTPVIFSTDSLISSDTTGIRYRFQYWQIPGINDTNRAEITLPVHAPLTAKVLWNREFHLLTEILPPYAGSLHAVPGGAWYTPGSVVAVHTAPVDSNFTFTGWQGDLSGSQQTQAITMNSPKQIQAHYTSSTIFPPMVHIPTRYSILEDSVLFISKAALRQMVSDANDPIDSLRFSLSGSDAFTLSESPEHPVEIRPDANWNGSIDLVFQATDPYGLTGQDTLHLTVLPVSDPPHAFSLIWPEDGAAYNDTQSHLLFTWSKSLNVDPADTITYMFNLSPDSTFSDSRTITVVALKDTFVTLGSNMISGNVFWGVNATDKQGMTTWCTKRYRLEMQSDVTAVSALPRTFALHQNFPNPFNGNTQIEYDLPKSGHVKIRIIDIRGQETALLLNTVQTAGRHSIVWHGIDGKGGSLASGIYFIQIHFNQQRLTRKMNYVR